MPRLEPWKQPPIAKVYEAMSAVADGRVLVTGAKSAEVLSSDKSKAYVVRWSKNRKVFTSTDNASKFGHYIGYPIIAVLMELGDLPVDRSVAGSLAGVPWKELNTRFKRDYEAAVEHVLASVDAELAVRQSAEAAHEKLGVLELVRMRGGRLEDFDTGNY
jgi:hypothetical protein